MAISLYDRAKKSTESRLSRYVQGGLTDKYNNRLGWWERYNFPKSDSDVRYIIPQSRDRRPDLVAKDVYNQVRLTWLVLQYNNIVDIETEFRAGAELLLPSQQRVFAQITAQPVGGKPVSR